MAHCAELALRSPPASSSAERAVEARQFAAAAPEEPLRNKKILLLSVFLKGDIIGKRGFGIYTRGGVSSRVVTSR